MQIITNKRILDKANEIINLADVSNSNKFSSMMKDIQKKAKAGDKIVIEAIVKMPDGRTVPVNTSFKLIGG